MNPLSDTSINTYIPQLEARGVIVDYDEPARTIIIQDANFEALLRETLNLPIDDITDHLLASLTELSGSTRGITDISGIENCINLERLKLERNNITDISKLASLTNLETALEKAWGSSSIRTYSSGLAWIPSTALEVVTTGFPIAMASRILFCIPRAIRRGITQMSAN